MRDMRIDWEEGGKWQVGAMYVSEIYLFQWKVDTGSENEKQTMYLA